MLSDTHRCFLARGGKEGREATQAWRGWVWCGCGGQRGLQAAAQPRLGMSKHGRRCRHVGTLGGGGEALTGPARFRRADTACDETMVAWQASRRQASRPGTGAAQAGVAQAAARWALKLMWRTWVGVVSLMRVPNEGGELTGSTQLFSASRCAISELPNLNV